MVIRAKALNVTTMVQPGFDLKDACVSVSFPFNSMIEDITTCTLPLLFRPESLLFIAPMVLGILVLLLLKHSF